MYRFITLKGNSVCVVFIAYLVLSALTKPFKCSVTALRRKYTSSIIHAVYMILLALDDHCFLTAGLLTSLTMMTPSTHNMRSRFQGLCQILQQICELWPVLDHMSILYQITWIRELQQKKDFVSGWVHSRTWWVVLHILICKWLSSIWTKSEQTIGRKECKEVIELQS